MRTRLYDADRLCILPSRKAPNRVLDVRGSRMFRREKSVGSVLKLLSALMLSGGATEVIAQTVPPLTREEIERNPILPAPTTSGSKISIAGDIEHAPCPLADEAYRNVKFQLQQVDFVGLPAELAPLLESSWRPDVGKTLPVASVCDIRDSAATVLRAQGYLAAVQVPPQRIENGKLSFTVLMAKLVGFQVRGAAGKSEGIIGRYLKKIQDQPVFNINDAERYLLLARDLPGYDVRMTLRPAGTVPGEVIGEVLVTRVPIEVEANIQNYGSQAVGRWGGLASVKFNGVLGQGDRTSLGFYATSDFDEQQVVQAGEEFKVGGEGLTLASHFTYAWSHPGLGANLNVRSRTLVANGEAHYPLLRTQANTLSGAVGFDYINQNTTVGGAALNADHLRVIYARLDAESVDPESITSTTGYSAAEPRWRAGGSLTVRQGLDIFSASQRNDISLTRIEGNPQAFVARANGYIEFRPAPKLTFSIAPRAQYSSDVVLAYEQVAGGNFTVGRGYDPGSHTGDSGYGLTNEVRIGSLIPKSVRATAVQAYAFLDADWVWNHASDRRQYNPESIYSAGGGVRVAWGEHMFVDAGVAVPLKTLVGEAGLRDVRFLINLTARLVPWSRR